MNHHVSPRQRRNQRGSVEDRWRKRTKDADGNTVEVPSAVAGKVTRWRARYVDDGGREIQRSFEGISRISRTIASRDTDLKALLASSKNVSRVLADRSEDLVDLMGSADLVFQELSKRKDAIHRPNEYVEIAHLERCTTVVRAFLMELSRTHG